MDTQREKRLKLSGMDREAIRRLQGLWADIEPHMEGILSRFYHHVESDPALAAILGGRADSLSRAQKTHWQRLFLSGFDDAYFDSAERIGMAHYRIGLEPAWYIMAYGFLFHEMVAVLKRHKLGGVRIQAVQDLNRAMMLEMDLAISVYQREMMNALRARTEAVEGAIYGFQGEFKAVVHGLEDGSAQLGVTADGLETVAGEARVGAQQLSQLSARAAEDAASVAAAAEEMTRSIDEIAVQVGTASGAIRTAASLTQTSAKNMERLNNAVARIDEIVVMINDIASQTNLLALNATIEAARAGDAGKGFAVVASEVKALATQTGRATGEIARQIEEIQSATHQATLSMDEIAGSVAEIDGSAAAMASAMTQQTAATSEIAARIQQVSDASRRIGEHIETLNDGMSETAKASGSVLRSSQDVRGQSDRLSQSVSAFFSRLRQTG